MGFDNGYSLVKTHNAVLDALDCSRRASQIVNLVELLVAAGMEHLGQVKPHHIYRRVCGPEIKHFGELYPSLECNDLINNKNLADDWEANWKLANADAW